MPEPKADYRATLQLPKTAFPMKADLVKREPETLQRWDHIGLYQRMREARRDAPRFVLHDGPPYANGNSHMGHLLNNVLKDAVLRYKFLRGFDVPFTPGWDCHGQPIEHNYLKTSGLDRRDVDALELRRACAEYALKWVHIQREQRKRVGAVGDWEHPYTTMDKGLEAVEVEVVGKLIRDGYIFRGKKPVLWCASCETALAENAVEYGPHIAPSIFVTFRVAEWPEEVRRMPGFPTDKKPAGVVVWTTTPWTLPANVALAFHPSFTYDLVDTGAERLLIAHELAAGVLKLGGRTATGAPFAVPGRALEGLKAQHPFLPRESVGVLADYVTLEAGSGVVHTAPGHGAEDFQTGQEYRLPVLAPVDGQGRFTDEFPEFAGRHVFEANPGIVALLKAKGALLHEGVLEHSYPFCWKCKNPVIFRATEQWFISLEHRQLKARSVEATKNVRWFPEKSTGRLGKMIDQRPDWCISRQRVWGVPIPVFYCTACNGVLATEASVNAVRDWVAQDGADVWWRKEADALLPAGTRCEHCGGRSFRKEADTLDVWFDSGVTHTSVVRARPELHWPADLYLEAGDQFRGWFQSSLLSSMALHGEPPYRAVMTHGWVLDPVGEKMSKSLGNVVSLEDAVNRWGADVMRVWALSEDVYNDMRVSAESMDRIVDAYRKLRNTLRFLLGNLADYAGPAPAGSDRPVDGWMRARLADLVRDVTADLDEYRFHPAFARLHQFCVVDLSAFYLDLLKDRLYASRADDPGRRAAQQVLAETFAALVRMLAVFIPFTADEAWQHAPAALQRGRGTVHLTEWPAAAPADPAAAADWKRVADLREAVLHGVEAARQAGTVASQLESRVTLTGGGDWLAKLAPHLPELLNVSQVVVAAGDGAVAVAVGKPEGAKCGRCWLVKPDTGSLASHPDLCGRCAGVVQGAGAP